MGFAWIDRCTPKAMLLEHGASTHLGIGLTVGKCGNVEGAARLRRRRAARTRA
jgi:hypothetical protein